MVGRGRYPDRKVGAGHRSRGRGGREEGHSAVRSTTKGFIWG